MKTFLLLFICIIAGVAFSQDTSYFRSKTIGVKTGITKLDFFSGPEIEYVAGRILVNSSVEMGLNRTFFQHRIFPRATVGFGYLALKKKVTIAPMLTISQSFLRLKRNGTANHYWTESYVGVEFSLGNKFRWTNRYSFGWMNERFKDFSTDSFMNKGVFGYYGSLGVSYRFD